MFVVIIPDRYGIGGMLSPSDAYKTDKTAVGTSRTNAGPPGLINQDTVSKHIKIAIASRGSEIQSSREAQQPLPLASFHKASTRTALFAMGFGFPEWQADLLIVFLGVLRF